MNNRNDKVNHLFIDKNEPLRNALVKMNEAPHLRLPAGIVLIVENKRLLGVVCDGDVRRALVKGVSLDIPVSQIMVKDPITVKDNLSAAQMIHSIITQVKTKGRIHDFKVDQVIVVNDKGEVVNALNFSDIWYYRDIANKKVCVLGLGYVGLTMSLILADLAFDTIGYDCNKELVNQLKQGTPHFYENGLEPLLRFQVNKGSIKFEADISNISADIYIISVGTPVDPQTQQPVMQFVENAGRDIGKVIKKGDLVILRSTVPIGITRSVVIPAIQEVSGLKAGDDFFLVFAPERAIEGAALQELKELPQVIGGIDKESAELAAAFFQKITPTTIILDSIEEAEMVKLINNTFRDVSFGYSNQIAVLCDSLGLDAIKIIKAANKGYKRNVVPMPSPGVGGTCLKKDPYILNYVASQINQSSALITEGRKANERMPAYVARQLQEFLDNHYGGEEAFKIYIMGLAFKGYPETSDIRNSTSIDFLNHLRTLAPRYKFHIFGFDAVVEKEVIESYGIHFSQFPEGFKDSHAVFVLNNHPQFLKIDIFSYLDLMKKPALFFDGWNMFSPREIRKVQGILYKSIGGGGR